MFENISSAELIRKIGEWRSVFIKITILSTLLIGIVVFIIPKQYKSVAIVFPSRQFSVSKLVIEANAGNQEDYMVLGYDDDCWALMQALNSDGLKQAAVPLRPSRRPAAIPE